MQALSFECGKAMGGLASTQSSQHLNQQKTMAEELKKLQEQMQQVLAYSLLAAKNVLNFEDVALLTGLSKSHLYKLTCTHQIPYYKPNGKQIYFDRGEIEAWMKQNRQNTTTEADQMAEAYVATRSQKGGIL